jgi:hypothetical protein
VSAAPAADDASAFACPSCGSPVRGDQAWCLRCGAAARTRLAPTPRWRAPIALLAALAVLTLAALVGGFVALTRDDDQNVKTPAATTAPTTRTAPAPGG